ncbi:hypothetical protein BN1051_01476 [Arthrobacter saudimassiliensis]|uniref:NfeD-like C-terminal domain-containing protein n=1 Tax=Arthrobacter saudimassiliensis TaxID=1461584 RepID=A0A078MLJ5_9MICC|nr:hypothetical protein BN1051_01476 [Arthrobacter saudimassiliensis]
MEELYQWLGTYGWAVWLVLFLGLAAVETLTLDLIFAMLSVGALAAMLGALFGAPLFLQVVIFCLVALLMILLVRPVALRHLKGGSAETRSNVDRLIGESAVALDTVGGSAGTVRLAGEVWTARTADGSTVAAGTLMNVARIDGATAVVQPAHGGHAADDGGAAAGGGEA